MNYEIKEVLLDRREVLMSTCIGLQSSTTLWNIMELKLNIDNNHGNRTYSRVSSKSMQSDQERRNLSATRVNNMH